MYKIYINEIPVVLKATNDIKIGDISKNGSHIVSYSNKPKQLKALIEFIEKDLFNDNVIIHSADITSLKTDFMSNLTVVEAAGGLISNELGEYLFIFRRGNWDLPKGKIEKGETKKQAAIREVMEETGIKNVSIVEKLTITYHIFTTKSGNRILKKSHWYVMKTEKQKLKAQKEEDIEKAEWLNLNKIADYKPIYANILHVVDLYKSRQKVTEAS